MIKRPSSGVVSRVMPSGEPLGWQDTLQWAGVVIHVAHYTSPLPRDFAGKSGVLELGTAIEAVPYKPHPPDIVMGPTARM